MNFKIYYNTPTNEYELHEVEFYEEQETKDLGGYNYPIMVPKMRTRFFTSRGTLEEILKVISYYKPNGELVDLFPNNIF